jgi:hypothetical protein
MARESALRGAAAPPHESRSNLNGVLHKHVEGIELLAHEALLLKVRVDHHPRLLLRGLFVALVHLRAGGRGRGTQRREPPGAPPTRRFHAPATSAQRRTMDFSSW